MPLSLRLLPLSIILGLWACGAEAPIPDAGGDAGSPDRADAALDAGTPPDSGPGRDAAPIDSGPGADSVRGTTLEGINIEWTEPLELCTAWQEGRSIEDELALKVHLSLGPEARPSLGSGDLSEATLTRGRVRLGPLAEEQQPIDGVTSTLVRYELQDPSGDTWLSAELDHAFPAGVLTEGYSVRRRVGDRSNVTSAELSFYFRPQGRSDLAVLQPCGGPAELDDGAFVLSAGQGDQALTLVRFARTRIAPAGSAPMVPTGAWLSLAAQPYDLIVLDGYWSQTYAALHHNWEEASVFDLTRDLALYKTVYEPFRTGRGTPIRPEMITRIGLAHIGGISSTPSLTLSHLDTGTGATREETLSTLAPAWARVDSSYLLQTFHDCSPAQVVTLYSGLGSVLQLITCPQTAPPGFSLGAVIPVLLPADPSQAGARFEAGAISAITDQGRAGYQVALPGHRLRITKNPNEEYYFVDLFDAQGNLVESSLAIASTLLHQPRDERLVAETIDASVQAVVVRRWAAQGVGESAIYAPVRFELRFGGEDHVVEAWDQMDYGNTHHNWEDSLVAHGDGLTMRWSVHWDNGPLVYRASASRDSDGAPVLPETILTLKD